MPYAYKRKPVEIRRDWLAKTLAGGMLGFTLALGCSSLFVQISSNMPLAIKSQLAMWMVVPIWLSTLAACYAFPSGWHAWGWIGSLNLLVFSLIAMLHVF